MKLDKIVRAASIDAALDLLNAALEDRRIHLLTVERDPSGFWIRVRRRLGAVREDDAEAGDVVAGGR